MTGSGARSIITRRPRDLGLLPTIMDVEGKTMGFVSDLHAIWRWVMLAVGAAAILKALAGWLGKRAWTRLDDQLGLLYTLVIDIQFLIGLVLWFAGPFNFRQLSVAMGNPLLRFYLVEHPLLMIVALALAHAGRSRSRKAGSAALKHRSAFVFYLLSFLIIVLIFLMRMGIR